MTDLGDAIARARALQPPDRIPDDEPGQIELPIDDAPGGPAYARADDPGTSWAAARSLDPVKMRVSQAAVFSIIGDYLSVTDEQIAAAYERLYVERGWPKQSPSGLRTRRAELVRANLVRASGEFGLTAAGHKTIKWEVVV